MTEAVSDVHVTRLIPGEPHKVWEAWTNPRLLARWWWPERFHTQYEIDLRPGGTYRYRTQDMPEIGVLDVRGRFLDVNPYSRLVYTWQWEIADDPETTVSVDFLPLGDQTELHLVHDGWTSDTERINHATGWNDCLDRLVSMQDGSPGTTS